MNRRGFLSGLSAILYFIVHGQSRADREKMLATIQRIPELVAPIPGEALGMAKVMYPLAYGAKVRPFHEMVLKAVNYPRGAMLSSNLMNEYLLEFIRRHEPDYPDLHTQSSPTSNS